MFRRHDGKAVRWRVLPGLTPFSLAVRAMQKQSEAVLAGAYEEVWLLESPPGFSRGWLSSPEQLTPAQQALVDAADQPHHAGGYSYHGPGVRCVAVMLNLKARRPDTHGFTDLLEEWIIAAMAQLGITGTTNPTPLDFRGIWVDDHGQLSRLAPMALAYHRWVSSWGFAINVSPNLQLLRNFVGCGLPAPTTSLRKLGFHGTMADVDEALLAAFQERFGPVTFMPLELHE